MEKLEIILHSIYQRFSHISQKIIQKIEDKKFSIEDETMKLEGTIENVGSDIEPDYKLVFTIVEIVDPTTFDWEKCKQVYPFLSSSHHKIMKVKKLQIYQYL